MSTESRVSSVLEYEEWFGHVMRPLLIPCLVGAVLAAGCRGGETPDRRRGDSLEPETKISFVEVGAEAGLAISGPTYAVAAADLDRDRWPDLAVSRHGSVALYRNGGDGRFENVNSMGDFFPGDTHGLSWTDLDNDGWLDLFVSIGAARGFGKGPNRIHRNLAGDGFALEGEVPEVLADPLGRGRCSCPVDFSGDGSLGLMVLNAPQLDRPHRFAVRSDGRWMDIAPLIGLAEVRAEGLSPVILGPEGATVLVAYGAGADSGRFFRFGDDGELVDVTDGLGISGASSAAMSVAPGDFDNDGDLDIYLVSGRGIQREVRPGTDRIDFRLVSHQPGQRQGFRFSANGAQVELDVLISGKRRPEMVRLGPDMVEVGELPWRADPSLSILEGVPEIDDTARRGVFVWREGNEIVLLFVGDGGRYRAASGHVIANGATVLSEIQPPARVRPAPNRLLENRGGSLVDVTNGAGVGDPASGRDAVFVDLDNDGDLDLYVVNGGTAFSNLPDVLYRNNGDGTFAEIADRAGVTGPELGRGGSALALDFDRDGAVDLLSCNGDGPPPGNEGPVALYRNRTSGYGWIEVDLRGTETNPFAIGAMVTARFEGSILAQQRHGGTGRFSTSVLPLHFGIGDAPSAEIEVVWPTGTTTTAIALSGERIVVREGVER